MCAGNASSDRQHPSLLRNHTQKVCNVRHDGVQGLVGAIGETPQFIHVLRVHLGLFDDVRIKNLWREQGEWWCWGGGRIGEQGKGAVESEGARADG